MELALPDIRRNMILIIYEKLKQIVLEWILSKLGFIATKYISVMLRYTVFNTHTKHWLFNTVL